MCIYLFFRNFRVRFCASIGCFTCLLLKLDVVIFSPTLDLLSHQHLCWLLHLSSSKDSCGHFLTNFRPAFSSTWCYCVISSPVSFLCLLSFFFVPAWGFVFVSGWGFAIWGFAFVSFMLKYLKFSCFLHFPFVFRYYFYAFYLEFFSLCFFLLISSAAEEFLFHTWLLWFTTNVVSFWKPGILFDFLHVWLLMDAFWWCCSFVVHSKL